MSIAPSLQNYLLKYQINDEDELFQTIYKKRFEKVEFPHVEKLELTGDISEDQMEDEYIKYKQDTYFYFIESAALTLPTAVGLFISRKLNQNVSSETLRLQRSFKIIGVFGIPSFVLFNIGAYRRFFKQYDPEVLLRKKYAFYLSKRDARKNY